jgi:hypothetical protein
MKRFKTQQAFFALIVLAVSVFLFTGCNSSSDEVALVTAQVDNVLPGACTAAGPQVIVSDPANAAEGVAINKVITATFDEVMDPTTIAYTNQGDPQVETFKLRDNNDIAFTEGTVVMDASNTRATFTPTIPLHGNSWYTATITVYAKNSVSLGNTPLGCSYQWQFKTVAP